MDKPLRKFRLLAIMILVACITGTASDIYSPSIPLIAQDLFTTIDTIQRSMAIFMLGVSLSQLIYGPLSEGLGRKQPLMLGLAIFMVGSMMAFLSTSSTSLIVSRFIQGAGAGACASLWRSIFRDSFSKAEIARYGGYIGIIMTYVVAAAPTIGGHLGEFFGWKSNFIFLLLYAAVTFLLTSFLLPETSIHHHKKNLNRAFFVKAFSELFSSKVFMGFSLCTFFTYGAFFSWFVVGPVVLIKTVGLSPVTFGWLNLILGGSAMTLSGLFNGRMVARLGSAFMLRLGWGLMGSAGLALIAVHFFFELSAFLVILPMFFFFFGGALIWPNAFAGAFAPFGKIAGYAGALYSFIQLGGGAVLGWISSFLPTTSALPVAIVFILCALIAWIVYESLAHRAQNAA